MENTPKVGNESGILTVRVLKIKQNNSDSKVKASEILEGHKEFEMKRSNLMKYARSEPKEIKTTSGKIFSVLICDDDTFQHLFYQNFFDKIANYDNLSIPKNEFHYDISYSGNELIMKYQKMQKEGIKDPPLVITDYYMGKTNLTGVSTAIELRKIGYKGHIILRTSETREEIIKNNPNFQKLLDEETINCLLDKSNLSASKDILQSYLNKIFPDPKV